MQYDDIMTNQHGRQTHYWQQVYLLQTDCSSRLNGMSLVWEWSHKYLWSPYASVQRLFWSPL